MASSTKVIDCDELCHLRSLVRLTPDLPGAFQAWMGVMAELHGRLGVYFAAVGIML